MVRFFFMTALALVFVVAGVLRSTPVAIWVSRRTDYCSGLRICSHSARSCETVVRLAAAHEAFFRPLKGDKKKMVSYLQALVRANDLTES